MLSFFSSLFSCSINWTWLVPQHTWPTCSTCSVIWWDQHAVDKLYWSSDGKGIREEWGRSCGTNVGGCCTNKNSSKLVVWDDAVDEESWRTPDDPALLIQTSSDAKKVSPVVSEGFLDEALSGQKAFLDNNAWWAGARQLMSFCFPAWQARDICCALVACLCLCNKNWFCKNTLAANSADFYLFRCPSSIFQVIWRAQPHYRHLGHGAIRP